jgi:hypothetical protein
MSCRPRFLEKCFMDVNPISNDADDDAALREVERLPERYQLSHPNVTMGRLVSLSTGDFRD